MAAPYATASLPMRQSLTRSTHGAQCAGLPQCPAVAGPCPPRPLLRHRGSPPGSTLPLCCPHARAAGDSHRRWGPAPAASQRRRRGVPDPGPEHAMAPPPPPPPAGVHRPHVRHKGQGPALQAAAAAAAAADGPGQAPPPRHIAGQRARAEGAGG